MRDRRRTVGRLLGAATLAFIAVVQAAPILTLEEPAGHRLTLGVDTVVLGRSNVGAPTAGKTLTVKNTGTDPPTVASAVPSGDLAGDFSTDFAGPVVIPAAGQATFAIGFTPTAPGLRTAVLEVASDDAVHPVAQIFLSGRGNDPQLRVEWPAGTPLLPATTAVAWGGNGHGQSTVPDALSDVRNVAAGRSHSLVARIDGTVIAWGKNDAGQATVPPGLASIRAVAAGAAHSLALDDDGFVTAWGSNADGQTTVPASLARVVAVAAGGNHSVALRADGTVVAWGKNDAGQATVPPTLTGVAAIAAGASHTIVSKTDGTVEAWGDNTYGQTTLPPGLTAIQSVAAGATFGMALRSNGTVAVWGKYWDGTDFVPVYLPAGLSNVKAIAAGDHHLVALKNNGTLLVWGYSDQTQADIPADLAGVQQIAAGADHTIALTRTAPVLDFGDQLVATPTAFRTLTVRNPGGAPLNLFTTAVTGGNSADFSLNLAGLASVLEPTVDSTTFTVRFTPAALGNRRSTLRLVTDDPDESPFDIALAGNGISLNPIDTWRQSYFGSTANSGIGADLSDPDNDGLVNLVEFAFGLDPKNASPSPLSPPQWTGDSAVLTIAQPSTVAGITYRAEWSETMATGSWLPVTDAGSGLQHLFIVTPQAKKPVFFRVRVTAP